MLGNLLLLLGRIGADHALVAEEIPRQKGIVGLNLVGVSADLHDTSYY